MFTVSESGIVKMSVVPRVMCRCSTFLIKIPFSLFLLVETGKLILGFTWKYKGSRITKTTSTNSKVRDLPDFKIYKASGI